MLTHAATTTFFDRFGPVTIKRGDICSGAGEAAQAADFGDSESNDLFDLLNARHILVWGKNVYTSSPHTLPVLRRARQSGTKLVLIDPVHHKTARLCELHVQPRPAGDFALAMAVARVLFDEGGVDPRAAEYCNNLEVFRQLASEHPIDHWCEFADVTVDTARDLAARLRDGPTTILVGWGMARRLNGGTIVRALDALGAITGNVGIPGGGVSFYFKRKGAFVPPSTSPPPRTICEPLFGPELEKMDDPPIRAVWVTAGNPVAMLPNSNITARALEACELVVVADSQMTDTAALADVVLPTTTLLEADELVGAYGNHFLGEARPVVQAPAQVKSDLQIMQALAERVGLADVMAGSSAEWKNRLLSPKLAEHGIDRKRLRAGVRNPLAAKVLFEGQRFATPSGKAELIADADANAVPRVDSDYPMMLLSLSTPDSQSSQWAKQPPKPNSVTVHPDAANGIADGAIATLESRVASMQVRVRHDEKQRRDVAIVPKGGHLRDGSCANALIEARTTDIGEGGALYDERVRLVAWDPRGG